MMHDMMRSQQRFSGAAAPAVLNRLRGIDLGGCDSGGRNIATPRSSGASA
jgi:hypothetical protein